MEANKFEYNKPLNRRQLNSVKIGEYLEISEVDYYEIYRTATFKKLDTDKWLNVDSQSKLTYDRSDLISYIKAFAKSIKSPLRLKIQIMINSPRIECREIPAEWYEMKGHRTRTPSKKPVVKVDVRKMF